jgi:hypothetical protein
VHNSSIEITNLLLAALLECGGGSVEGIESKNRYSKITVNLDHFSRGSLYAKVDRLARVIERAESDEELKHLFSATVMGELEDKYVRLKKRVVKERGHSNARQR